MNQRVNKRGDYDGWVFGIVMRGRGFKTECSENAVSQTEQMVMKRGQNLQLDSRGPVVCQVETKY